MRVIWLSALFGITLAASCLSRDPFWGSSVEPSSMVLIKHSRRATIETLSFYRQMRAKAQEQATENRFQIYLADKGIEWESKTSLPVTSSTTPAQVQEPQVQQTIQSLDDQVQHQRKVNGYLRDLDVEQARSQIQATIPEQDLMQIREYLQRKAMAW